MSWDATLRDDRGHIEGDWGYTHNCNGMIAEALTDLGCINAKALPSDHIIWQVVDAWNSSEARDELAKSPPAGTPTVTMFDQDAPWRLTLPHDEDIVWPLPPLYAQPRVEMTPAETDRLIANLQALPGEEEGDRG